MHVQSSTPPSTARCTTRTLGYYVACVQCPSRPLTLSGGIYNTAGPPPPIIITTHLSPGTVWGRFAAMSEAKYILNRWMTLISFRVQNMTHVTYVIWEEQPGTCCTGLQLINTRVCPWTLCCGSWPTVYEQNSTPPPRRLSNECEYDSCVLSLCYSQRTHQWPTSGLGQKRSVDLKIGQNLFTSWKCFPAMQVAANHLPSSSHTADDKQRDFSGVQTWTYHVATHNWNNPVNIMETINRQLIDVLLWRQPCD